MKTLNYFLFYTYVGLVIVAGFWGAFINPYFDLRLLFDLEPNTLTEYTKVNILSQYRFLRAIELGFGLFSVIFFRQIFYERQFNTLFLTIMSLGVLARVFSIIVDGMPSSLFLFFLIYEMVGVVVIYMYSKTTIHQHVVQ